MYMGDSVEPRRTLRDLGYHFNQRGQLRTIIGDNGFQFTTQNDYELLGEAVTHELYDLMENLGLRKIPLKKQNDDGPDSHFSFIFASADYDKKKTLLVLIHGSGAVRAGQWARSLIINDDLEKGSQIPYIEKALSLDYGVLVFNSNHNVNNINDEQVTLRYSRDSKAHCIAAWHRFVTFTQCESIYVVAHSRGGRDISAVMQHYPDEKRVRTVCLTDSHYSFSTKRDEQPIVINWTARNPRELDKPSPEEKLMLRNRVHQVWAGTMSHEMSSSAALASVFHVIASNPTSDTLNNILIEAWNIIDPPRARNVPVNYVPPQNALERLQEGMDEVATNGTADGERNGNGEKDELLSPKRARLE